jgi:hypothetical protein
MARELGWIPGAGDGAGLGASPFLFRRETLRIQPAIGSGVPEASGLGPAAHFCDRRAFRVTAILYLTVLFNCRAGWPL